jgi:dTDP-4-dehydrorhamnose reductase
LIRETTLLLGRSGQLGTALAPMLNEVTTPDRKEFDLAFLSHDRAQRLIDEVRPSVLINCAAYTAVDAAEDDVATANRVNGTSVGLLAEVAAQAQIPFVTYSTDYVFDGQGSEPYVESSPTDPINAYGASKLIGERLALQANPRTLVIRTSWIVSGTHPNFVATMLRLAKEGRSLRVVSDQYGCPTVASDLARATLEAMEASATGLLHLTNTGATTWFELARTAVALAGLDPDLIEPCPTEEYPTPARRPAYSVLASERIGDLGMSGLPAWQDSLPEVVRRQMTPSQPS